MPLISLFTSLPVKPLLYKPPHPTNSFNSSLHDCPSGVPQGSNLGPYLFLLYIADVHKDLVNSRCLLYADDLKLFRVIRGNGDRELLQHDLNRLAEWSSKNKIPLHIKKCYTMTFTRSLQPIETTYSIGGETLECHGRE